MKTLSVDFETYYADDYTLKKLTTEEYVRDPRFKVQCLAVVPFNTPGGGFVLSQDEIAPWVKEQDWSETTLLCHHAAFDIFILWFHYRIAPAFILDTYSISRGLYGPLARLSLGDLAKRFGLSDKTVPYDEAKGHQWEEMEPELRQRMMNGCLWDAQLTAKIFLRLLDEFPKPELRIIDLTLRMFTEPEILGDEALFTKLALEEHCRKNETLIRLGVTEKQLQSSATVARMLEALGETVPLKPGKNGSLPCLAKTDEYMQELCGRDDTVGELARARLDVRSTLQERRASRLAGIASRGPMPVYLHYAGAVTKRWSGGGNANLQNLPRSGGLRQGLRAPEGKRFVIVDFCIAEGQLVMTRNHGLVPIENIGVDDFVWDGLEWVSHAGVVYRGEREVWTYQGLTSTPDHKVRVKGYSGWITLAEAAEKKLTLRKTSPSFPLYKTPLHRSFLSRLQDLWSARNSIQVPIRASNGGLRFERATSSNLRRLGSGPNGQRWPLRAGQFAFVDKTRERKQSLHNSMGFAWRLANGALRFYASLSRMFLLTRPNRRPRKKGSYWGANNCTRHREKKKVYDIVNAGPRRRFTVSGVLVSNCQVEYRVLCGLAGQKDKLDALADPKRDLYCEFGSKLFDRAITKDDKQERFFSKIIVLSSGYGTGKAKAAATARNLKIDLSQEVTDAAIDLYREEHDKIVKLWARCDRALSCLGEHVPLKVKDLPIKFADNSVLWPNGLKTEFDLAWCKEERGWYRRTSRGAPAEQHDTRADLLAKGYTSYWGGGLTEMLCQGLARICLSDLMLRVYSAFHIRPCLLVHDEYVCLVDKDAAYDIMLWIVRWAGETPKWWPGGPPMGAEGFVSTTYDKK